MRTCSHIYAMTVEGLRKEYREFLPCPALAPYVSVFWTTCSFGKQVPVHCTRVLPDGCIDIVFSDESGSGLKEGHVVGAMTRSIVARSQGIVDPIAVRFRPGGAVPFLRMSLHAITDSSVAWSAVSGPETVEVEERLSQQGTISERINLLEKFLLRRLRSPHIGPNSTLQLCIGEIVEAGGRLPISRLAQRAGYSARHLGRIFRDHVGVAPKRFCELVRFLNVAQSIRQSGYMNGAALAVDHGYFDQAHLIKEFHQLAGLSPAQFALHALGTASPCPIPTIQDPARLLHS